MPSYRHCQPPVHVRVPLASMANLPSRRSVRGAALECGAQCSTTCGASGTGAGTSPADRCDGTSAPPADAAAVIRNSRRERVSLPASNSVEGLALLIVEKQIWLVRQNRACSELKNGWVAGRKAGDRGGSLRALSRIHSEETADKRACGVSSRVKQTGSCFCNEGGS